MVQSLETRFVSACLEGRWNPVALDEARALSRNTSFTWEVVREIAQTEELAPLLYNITRSQNLVPADLEKDLADSYYFTVARNSLLFDDLEQVLSALVDRNIRVILLKGAALAETMYGSVAVRPMEDLDLLVHRDTLPMAVAVLSEFCVDPSGRGHAAEFTEYMHQAVFVKTGKTRTAIDLHWNLLDSPFYPHTLLTDWVWKTAVPVRVGRAPALVLGPEALLLHLCGHMMIDEGRKDLLWHFDIGYTIAQYRNTINWERLIAQAKSFCLAMAVQRAILKIKDEWPGLIPQQVQDDIEHLTASPSELAFYEWANSKDRAAVRLLKTNMASLPNWRMRLRYILRSLFPPISYMQYRYGIQKPLLVLFAFPYRWFLSLYRAVIR